MEKLSIPSISELNAPEERAAFIAACEERFTRQMRDVIEKIGSDHDLKILGLTGPSCSGKTTVADLLMRGLREIGRRVEVISIDDFYKDVEALTEDTASQVDFESPDALYLEDLARCAADLRSGRGTDVPIFSFHERVRTGTRPLPPSDDTLYIFEGIQVLYPEVQQCLGGAGYATLFIRPESAVEIGGVIFEPDTLRLMRRLVRDYYYRNSTPSMTLDLWRGVRESEEMRIFPFIPDNCLRMDTSMAYGPLILAKDMRHLMEVVLHPEDGVILTDYPDVARSLAEKLQAIDAYGQDLFTAADLPKSSLFTEFVK